MQPAAFDHLGNGHLGCRSGQPLGQGHGDVVGAFCPRGQDVGLGFGELKHSGFFSLVVVGREGGDTPHEIVLAIGVGRKDHFAIVVGLQIVDLAQPGDGMIAGDAAISLPCCGDRRTVPSVTF